MTAAKQVSGCLSLMQPHDSSKAGFCFTQKLHGVQTDEHSQVIQARSVAGVCILSESHI